MRWASGDHGTVVSRIDIVRAIGRGEPFQTLPFVRPGGDILLRLDSWSKVQRALAAIDAVLASHRTRIKAVIIGASAGGGALVIEPTVTTSTTIRRFSIGCGLNSCGMCA